MTSGRFAGPLALAKARRGGLLGPLVFTVSVVYLLWADRSDPVPFRNGVLVTLGPLLVALPGVLLCLVVQRPEPVMEQLAGRRLGRWRWAWLGTCITALGLPSLLVTGLDPIAREVAVRNLAFAAATTLATGVLAGASAAWLPGATFIVVSYWFGTYTNQADAHAWAVLQQPVGNHVLTLVAVTACAATAAGYAVFDFRHT